MPKHISTYGHMSPDGVGSARLGARPQHVANGREQLKRLGATVPTQNVFTMRPATYVLIRRLLRTAREWSPSTSACSGTIHLDMCSVINEASAGVTPPTEVGETLLPTIPRHTP